MTLKLSELKASKSFLVQAHILVSAVRALFYGASDKDTAARMNDIAIRIEDEREFIERLIGKAPNGSANG